MRGGPNALLKRRGFVLHSMDEFRTSKMCNACFGELTGYRKKGGSRLFCSTCSQRRGRPVFVDWDRSTASNILLAGTCSSRSSALSRRKVRSSVDSTDSHEVGGKSCWKATENRLPLHSNSQ